MLEAWRLLGGMMPHRWKRYIDDIIFFWRGSEQQLLIFVEFLNNFHPTIKFKCKEGVNHNFTTKQVDFFDMTIWVDDIGTIQTTLYTKPGRVVQYLSPSSSHPSHITQNIPYSLAYRLRRLESLGQKFETNLNQLKKELSQRGYKKNSIQMAFTRVRALSRTSTLEKVVKQPESRLTLVIPFDKRLPNISGILHHRWQCLISRDPGASDYLPKPPRVAYKRTPSLRDILVRSKVPHNHRSRRQATSGFKNCGRPACSTCSHSINTLSHTCNHTGESFNINSLITFSTPGVIHSVTCKKDSIREEEEDTTGNIAKEKGWEEERIQARRVQELRGAVNLERGVARSPPRKRGGQVPSAGKNKKTKWKYPLLGEDWGEAPVPAQEEKYKESSVEEQPIKTMEDAQGISPLENQSLLPTQNNPSPPQTYAQSYTQSHTQSNTR